MILRHWRSSPGTVSNWRSELIICCGFDQWLLSQVAGPWSIWWSMGRNCNGHHGVRNWSPSCGTKGSTSHILWLTFPIEYMISAFVVITNVSVIFYIITDIVYISCHLVTDIAEECYWSWPEELPLRSHSNEQLWPSQCIASAGGVSK